MRNTMQDTSSPQFFKKSDIIIILLILLAAIGFLLWQRAMPAATTATISIDSAVRKTIDLSTAKDEIFQIDGYDNMTFEIKDGAIRILDSDCYDRICVRVGFISKKGQSAVCLPNRTVVELSGDGDIDVVIS